MSVREEAQVVNGLWIGPRLSPLERLCVSSFVRHGNRFRLWLYGPMEEGVPAGVEVADANEVMPRSSLRRSAQMPIPARRIS